MVPNLSFSLEKKREAVFLGGEKGKQGVWVGWPVETRNSEQHLGELLPVTRLNLAA